MVAPTSNLVPPHKQWLSPYHGCLPQPQAVWSPQPATHQHMQPPTAQQQNSAVKYEISFAALVLGCQCQDPPDQVLLFAALSRPRADPQTKPLYQQDLRLKPQTSNSWVSSYVLATFVFF